MARDGYRVELQSPQCVLRSGVSPYWQIEFAALLREVNEKVGEAVFPPARYNAESNVVVYSLLGANGNDILWLSHSLKSKSIPESCLMKLQSAVDLLHEWAENPNVPQGKRDFCRSFRLPDPRKNPDAYRLTGGVFSRKLHVLLGYEKEGTEAILPSSRISAKWSDAESRKSIFEECRGSALRRLFRPRNILLFILLASAIYLGVFYEVVCAVHKCVVGKGVLHFLKIEETCPKRCAWPGCNRHLDADEKCNAHKCSKCGRPLSNAENKNGVCDECFLQILH